MGWWNKMIRDKKIVNKDDYENLAVCIRSDQVPAKDVAEYFKDKEFYKWYSKKYFKDQ